MNLSAARPTLLHLPRFAKQSAFSLRLLGTLLAALSLTSCDEAPIQQTRLQHFGTEIEVKLVGASEQQAREIFQRLDARLGDWHRRWHAWQPSDLTRLNSALQQGQTVPISADLAGLLRRSQRFSADSEQLFNPGLGQRLAAWGFQRADPTAALPTPAAVEASSLPTMAALVIAESGNRATVRSEHPDLQLDLGGIAKGYALNQLLIDLARVELAGAYVNLGGDIGVLGSFRGRPWRVGVLAGPDRVAAAISLQSGEQAFSSGTYFRQHDTDTGEPAHHILDPRTGNPADGNLAVTVIGADGERLQVASKVLLIAGRDWRRHAEALQTPLALVVAADGVIEVTAELAQRLEADAAERAKWRVVP